MEWNSRGSRSLALILIGTNLAWGQAPVSYSPPGVATQPPEVVAPYAGFALESHSIPGETAEDIVSPFDPARFGPTPVSDVRILMDGVGLSSLFGDSGIRAFGWIESGYTYSSSGSGLLATQPRLNRYGNEFLLNEMAFVLQKPLKQDRFDWGFNIRYFAGSNAALGQPLGGIDDVPGNPRFSHDFRDLSLSVHLPILTDGGVDVKVGRMNTIFGWNGFLAPYRPFYSSNYQFFYSQDGAFTGFLTTLHVSKQLDVVSGMTLGANTFFTKRSENSYCYLGQVNYALTEARDTVLTASVYAGPDAIFAAPGMNGDFATIVELRVQHSWNTYLTQIVECNMGWDANTPVGTGSWYAINNVGILHVTECLDLQARGDWFNDVGGTRTGIDTNYCGITLGLNWHPTACLEIRPEIRGDFAGAPAFGNNNSPRDRSMFTAAIGTLIKF